MARITIEFDTGIPEQYSAVVEVLELLGKRPTPPVEGTPPIGVPFAHIEEGERPDAPTTYIPKPPVPRVVTGTPTFGDEQANGATLTTSFSLPPDLKPAPVPVPKPPVNIPASILELDSEGIPWDARIHTERRTKRQKDQTWKLTRGVTEERVAEVKAELRKELPPVPTPPAAQVPTAPAPPVSGQPKYQQLMLAVTKAIGTGRLTTTDVEKACTNAGLDAPKDLATNLELVPQVAAELGVVLC